MVRNSLTWYSRLPCRRCNSRTYGISLRSWRRSIRYPALAKQCVVRNSRRIRRTKRLTTIVAAAACVLKSAGSQYAEQVQALRAMTPQEILETVTCRIVGGTTHKPTSAAKKAEAL